MPEKFTFKPENLYGILAKDDSLLQVLQLYYHFNRLKNIYRKGWLDHGISPKDCESVADHTGGTIFLALLLSIHYKISLDQEKLMKMALIHDLAESRLGDITPREITKYARKSSQEIEIIMEWFQNFPEGEEFIQLFNEFEFGSTIEGRFLKIVDKLEMMLQANIYEKTFSNLDLGNFYDFSKILTHREFSPILQEFKSKIEEIRNNK